MPPRTNILRRMETYLADGPRRGSPDDQALTATLQLILDTLDLVQHITRPGPSDRRTRSWGNLRDHQELVESLTRRPWDAREGGR